MTCLGFAGVCEIDAAAGVGGGKRKDTHLLNMVSGVAWYATFGKEYGRDYKS